MATSAEPPEIHITRTLSPETVKDARLSWIVNVDELLDEDSLDIMKLNFQGELTEAQLERIRLPSDLYHALAEKCYTDPDMQLSRFIYALEKLGHRRYGCRAIRKLEERFCPAPLDLAKLKVDMNYFILLQRLTVLCCMLPDECNSKFSAFFAKKADTNPNKYPTPCKIIKKCLKKHIITSENHLDMLEEALIRVGLTENQIQEYFDNFQKVAGFGCPRNSNTSDLSSSDKSPPKKGNLSYPSDRTSDTSSPVPPSTRWTGSSAKTSSSREASSRSPTLGEAAASMVHRQNTQGIATETTPLLEGRGPPDEQGTQREAGANGQGDTGNTQRPTRNWNKKKKCLVGLGCVTILILLVLTAGAAALTGFAAKQYVTNKPTTQRYHENSSVILTELSHFYTETLSVTEDTEHLNDFDDDIKVYQTESRCSDLVNETTYTIRSSNSSYTSTTYALAGSSIAMNICGSTNQTTYPERLEILLLNHLDEPYINQHPFKMNFLEPGLGEMKCKQIRFNLSTPGYYTVKFLPPSTPVSVKFEINYTIQAVDTQRLTENFIANYTLHSDQDNCKFTMSADFKYSCFVAVIRETPHINGDMHIQLRYGNRWAGLIAGVVVLVVMTLIFVILVVIALVRCALY